MNWNDKNIQVITELNNKFIKENSISNNSITRAATKLNLHRTTVIRKVAAFQKYGLKCFIHGNTGKIPANKKEFPIIRKKIEENHLLGCNFSLTSELLESCFGIKISSSCLRNYMFQEGILSPKCNRKTRRKLKKLLKQKQKESNKKTILTKDEKITLNALETEEYVGHYTHPTKPRSKYLGERIELDASKKAFIPGLGPMTLHVAVDDASGCILGLWIEKEETLHGYYMVMLQVLSNYGIPVAIRTDKRTVFTYQKTNANKPENDTFTQFAYAMSQLGCELTCNSDPDFKPKVERMNQTLQGQLYFYFALNNIITVEKANKYLQKTFISLFNDKYSYATNRVNGRSEKVQSAFEPCTQEQINNTLVCLFERKVNKGCTISYKSKYYALYDETSKQIALNKGTKVTVVLTLKGELLATREKGKNYSMVQVPERYLYSPSIDFEKPPKVGVKYKPSQNHPWSYSQQMYFKEHSAMMRQLYTV